MTHQLSLADVVSSRSEKDRKDYVRRIPGHMRSFRVETTDKKMLIDDTRKIKCPVSGKTKRVPVVRVPKKGKNKGKEIPCMKRIHLLIHTIFLTDEHGTDFKIVVSRKGATIHGIKMIPQDKWTNPVRPGTPWEKPAEDWIETDEETGEKILCRPWIRLPYPTMEYPEDLFAFLAGMIHPDDVLTIMKIAQDILGEMD